MTDFVELVRIKGSHLRIVYKSYMEGTVYCMQALLRGPFARAYVGRSKSSAVRAAQACARMISKYELPDSVVNYQPPQSDMEEENLDSDSNDDIQADHQRGHAFADIVSDGAH